MGNENYMINQLMKGYNLLTRNDYNAGLICFNKAINNITDKTDKVTSAKAFKYRGLCQQKLGSYSKALTDLKNSETLNSGDIPIYYNLGHLLYTMEEYNESRETLKKFLSKLKGSNIEDSDYLKQESYKYLALIESQLKNLKEAIEYIDTALKLSGNKEEFIYLKGVIYLENNNFDLALSEFNKISEESNEFLEALNGKISIYEKKNDYESAITMITELEKKYPKKDTFSYNHGIILLKQKKYDAAIEKFTKNIGLLNRENLDDQAKEKLSLNYTARAYCYLSLKKDKDALSDSRKSLTLIPLSLNATYFLSRCLLNKSPLTNEIYDELFDTKAFYIVNTLQKILFEPESESKKKFIEKVREVFF